MSSLKNVPSSLNGRNKKVLVKVVLIGKYGRCRVDNVLDFRMCLENFGKRALVSVCRG